MSEKADCYHGASKRCCVQCALDEARAEVLRLQAENAEVYVDRERMKGQANRLAAKVICWKQYSDRMRPVVEAALAWRDTPGAEPPLSGLGQELWALCDALSAYEEGKSDE